MIYTKDIIEAVSRLRITKRNLEEKEIQNLVEKALQETNIDFEKEKNLAPRNRVDLFIDGIVVEIKKRRPPRTQVINQLTRYASLPAVREVVLILERYMDLPEEINGKPVSVVSLNKLWGMAL